MRGVHRSLKRNWILDAYAFSNSNLTFLRGERGRGFIPPFLLVFASSISSLPSRSHSSIPLLLPDSITLDFNSILPRSFQSHSPRLHPSIPLFSIPIPPFHSHSSIAYPFQFHSPSPPSITIPLPRFQSLFDYTPSAFLITTLPDYAPFDYTLSTYLSISRSIVSIAMVAAVTNRKCKIAWSYEGGRGRIYGPSGIRDTCSQPRINI